MSKRKVIKRFPHAYCVRLDNKTGYVVWRERGVRPRGFEVPAIGFGTTAREAWGSVRIDL